LKSEHALGNRIFSAYGTSLLGVFSGLITNFWLLRKITQEIPASTFGIYALVLQVTAYLAILQLGLDFAAARKIAECVGRQDGEGANCSHWEVARFNRYVGLGGTLLVLIVAAALWRGIGVSNIATGHLAAVIALFAGAAQVLNFFSLSARSESEHRGQDHWYIAAGLWSAPSRARYQLHAGGEFCVWIANAGLSPQRDYAALLLAAASSSGKEFCGLKRFDGFRRSHLARRRGLDYRSNE
jgi:apolipoprotein N-acyltransferase